MKEGRKVEDGWKKGRKDGRKVMDRWKEVIKEGREEVINE